MHDSAVAKPIDFVIQQPNAWSRQVERADVIEAADHPGVGVPQGQELIAALSVAHKDPPLERVGRNRQRLHLAVMEVDLQQSPRVVGQCRAKPFDVCPLVV
jgi:hypothetical protein